MLHPLLLAALAVASQTGPQRPTSDPAATQDITTSTTAAISTLGLDAGQQQQLRQAMADKQYRPAQALLLGLLAKAPDAARRYTILTYLGSVYFLDHDPTQAAIAWNKADAIRRLPATLRFSLAMAYVQIGHRDWAEGLLSALHAADPANALYPFWLGRIAYDRQLYDAAILHFRDAIRLDPNAARAHDNLGLSLYDLNQVDAAIAEFQTAINLNRTQNVHSPWPSLNLGIAYDFRGQSEPALAAFREAIAQDPAFAQAYYRLGNTLLKLGRIAEALQAEQTAATLDPAMAEPHFVLARLYRRQNRAADSTREEAEYRRLHQQSSAPAAQREEH